jgi:hypothetical protein
MITAAAHARFTLYLRFFNLIVVNCSQPPPMRGSHCACADVSNVSISDKMATFHSFADLPVSVPFQALVAMTQ